MVDDELVGRGGLDARAAAFSDLIDHHLDDSYRLAALILRNPHEAEDVTHDAVLTAWRQWHRLRDHGRFEPWFSRILMNLCRDRLRQRSRRPTAELDDGADARARDPYRPAEDREALGRAFVTLDVDHRIAVVLRFYRDLTIEQIAERTGTRPGTVKSRLHYALRQLRRELDRAAPAEGRS